MLSITCSPLSLAGRERPISKQKHDFFFYCSISQARSLFQVSGFSGHGALCPSFSSIFWHSSMFSQCHYLRIVYLSFLHPKLHYAWLTPSSRHRLPLLVSWQTATYFFSILNENALPRNLLRLLKINLVLMTLAFLFTVVLIKPITFNLNNSGRVWALDIA